MIQGSTFNFSVAKTWMRMPVKNHGVLTKHKTAGTPVIKLVKADKPRTTEKCGINVDPMQGVKVIASIGLVDIPVGIGQIHWPRAGLASLRGVRLNTNLSG